MGESTTISSSRGDKGEEGRFDIRVDEAQEDIEHLGFPEKARQQDTRREQYRN